MVRHWMIDEVDSMRKDWFATRTRSPAEGSSQRTLRGIGRTCLALAIIVLLAGLAYGATSGSFAALTPYQRSVMLLIGLTFAAIVTFNLALWRYVQRTRATRRTVPGRGPGNR